MGFFIFQYRINKMMKEINVFTFIIFDLLTHGTESKLTAQDWGGGGNRNKREMQAFSSRGTRRQLIIFFFIFM